MARWASRDAKPTEAAFPAGLLETAIKSMVWNNDGKDYEAIRFH